jgi:hypothetical protein
MITMHMDDKFVDLLLAKRPHDLPPMPKGFHMKADNLYRYHCKFANDWPPWGQLEQDCKQAWVNEAANPMMYTEALLNSLATQKIGDIYATVRT